MTHYLSTVYCSQLFTELGFLKIVSFFIILSQSSAPGGLSLCVHRLVELMAAIFNTAVFSVTSLIRLIRLESLKNSSSLKETTDSLNYREKPSVFRELQFFSTSIQRH